MRSGRKDDGARTVVRVSQTRGEAHVRDRQVNGGCVKHCLGDKKNNYCSMMERLIAILTLRSGPRASSIPYWDGELTW